MAVHLELVVTGPPISNQQSTAQGRASLLAWRSAVAGEARKQWMKPLLPGELKAVIINFFAGDKPSLDLDNMSKPILDVMQKIVYRDDRQIRQAEISHLQIGGAYSIVGVSKLIVDSLHAGRQFVYLRVEDPVDPFPLPK